jgi:hypothetical protein
VHELAVSKIKRMPNCVGIDGHVTVPNDVDVNPPFGFTCHDLNIFGQERQGA